VTKTTIVGAGSWGTALSYSLASNKKKVTLWGRVEDGINEVAESRQNPRFLPGVILPQEVEVSNDLEKALAGAKNVVLAVPSHIVREVTHKIAGFLEPGCIVINVAKGIETETLLRLSQVIEEELSGKNTHISVLSGPSHAEEVGRGVPTAVVVGAKTRQVAEKVQDLFMSPLFRVYTNPDLVGIELGAALKNIIALAVGITEGLGYGDNSKAALITRGLAEIARLGVAAGANPLTFAGLTGVGDLIVTCTSMHSRNHRAGIQIGQGVPLDVVLERMGMVVEGVRATQAAYRMKDVYQVAMPICEETYHVLFNKKDTKEAVMDLMLRQRTHEVEKIVMNPPLSQVDQALTCFSDVLV